MGPRTRSPPTRRARREAAETITGKGGHFAMVQKGSRKSLRKDVRDPMEGPEAAKEMPSNQDAGGRGHAETRTATELYREF